MPRTSQAQLDVGLLLFSLGEALSRGRHSGGTDADAVDIQRCLDGDDHAYRRIIERHQQAIARLLWRFTRRQGEHEELVQQVFVQAYLNLNKYGQKAPLAHWLAGIATRIGYSYWRANSRKARSLDHETWQGIEQNQHSLDRTQAAELAHDLLAQLEPRDRLVLTLRYIEQCDVQQTAYRTGWTQTLVRVRTHRAIKKLKKLAKQAQIELELP